MDNFLCKLPNVLSNEEQKQLFIIKNDDFKAREKLIIHNIRLVMYTIKEFSNTKIEEKDLISIGIIGLIKAVDSYRICEIPFSNYAIKCITNEILMALRKEKKHFLNCSLETILYTSEEGNELKFNNVLEDLDKNIVFNYEEKEMLIRLRKCINDLPDRERKIIELYYGFTQDRMVEREISKELGISRSYVSKILIKTVKLLTKELI